MLEGKIHTNWRNLAPDLIRQRVLIEATTNEIVLPTEMDRYMLELAEVVDMEVVNGPYSYTAHEDGYGGWIHWKTSGAHVYSYPTRPNPLITVDCYTCKPFNPITAAEFTRDFFKTLELVYREIEI